MLNVKLYQEGLASVADFIDFKEDELKAAFKNARTGIPGTPMIPAIPAVMQGNNVAQAAVPAIAGIPRIPSVPIPARSITHLLIASVAYHYYVDTGRAVTNTNMQFTNILRDFHVEWKAFFKNPQRCQFYQRIRSGANLLRISFMPVLVYGRYCFNTLFETTLPSPKKRCRR